MAVPMDKESVTARLREVAELSHLCRQLAGPRWPCQMANLSCLFDLGETSTPSPDTMEEPAPPYRAHPLS